MIDMMHCVELMLNNFFDPKLSTEKVTASAAKHLFDVDSECLKLIKEFADKFHAIVMQELFVCKKAN